MVLVKLANLFRNLSDWKKQLIWSQSTLFPHTAIHKGILVKQIRSIPNQYDKNLSCSVAVNAWITPNGVQNPLLDAGGDFGNIDSSLLFQWKEIRGDFYVTLRVFDLSLATLLPLAHARIPSRAWKISIVQLTSVWSDSSLSLTSSIKLFYLWLFFSTSIHQRISHIKS